jgi:predicted ATPase/DNA-binding SARP family transcriptional activator
MGALRTEFAILGPIEVRRDGQPVALRGAKVRALLALLLMRANTPVSADELIEQLWHGPLQDAANSVHVCVSRLRKIVGPDILSTRADGYFLRLRPGELDAHEFEQLLAEGQAALRRGDSAHADGLLSEALGLWRGNPLAELSESGVFQSEIQRLEELRLTAVESRAEAVLQLGGGRELVAELKTLVGKHPLNDRLRALLVRSLYRAGRQADALSAYREGSRVLHEELGLEPSRELRKLERAVLLHDSALDPVNAARSLPQPPTSLLGRETEVAHVIHLLSHDKVRLLTLSGPGGIGKTRVALEAARRFDQAVFVDLANTTNPRLIASEIAAALGVVPTHGETLETGLCRLLRDQELLLLLDSFEHLVDEAPLLSRLLADAPALKLLVTSRSVLRTEAENEFPILPLDIAHAVELFAERAKAIDPHFRAEANDIDQICRRLDGLPLAIELAAARTKLFPPAAMLKRLQSGSDLLAGGRRDAPERQRTLRATLDWSYALLEPQEQLLLARLGAFAGGFTVEAAEAIAADRNVVELIASLVDKSLVQRRDERPRFSLLDTVREYALQRLAESDVESETRLRHAEYYITFVADTDSDFDGPGEKLALDKVESEHANIRAAQAFALRSNNAALALRLTAACRRFWHSRGYHAEGRAALDSALAIDAKTQPATEPEAQVKALNGAGIFAVELGDLEAATGYFERSADLASRFGFEKRHAFALGNQGLVAFRQGRHERARLLIEEALAQSPNDDTLRDIALESLAEIRLAENDLDHALALAEEARALAQAEGSPRRCSAVARTLGRVRLTRGELDEATGPLEESLRLALELESPQALAESLDALAGLVAARGDGIAAALLLGAATSVRTSVGTARSPHEETERARHAALARAASGDRAFAECEAAGRALPLSEILLQAGIPQITNGAQSISPARGGSIARTAVLPTCG